MNEISRNAIVAGLGTAAVAFLGYCIYFDHKRRSDPEYKKKVRERKSLKQSFVYKMLLCNLYTHVLQKGAKLKLMMKLWCFCR